MRLEPLTHFGCVCVGGGVVMLEVFLHELMDVKIVVPGACTENQCLLLPGRTIYRYSGLSRCGFMIVLVAGGKQIQYVVCGKALHGAGFTAIDRLIGK